MQKAALKENEWECDACRKVNTYDLKVENSYQCQCGYRNKAIKDLILQYNDIDLVNHQRELMSQPSQPRVPK